MYKELIKGIEAYLNGNWEAAHEVAQAAEGTLEYDKLHAFLHRAEGDSFNASYWYRRAGMEMPRCSLEQEAEELLTYFERRAVEGN
jgi:hypothetical protein